MAPPSTGSAPVLISLPDGLNISGVTLWALRLARVLAAAGRDVTLALHADSDPAFADAVPPGVRALSLAHLPSLRTVSGDLSPFIPAYRDAIRRVSYAARRPVVYLPTLLGDSFAIGAAIALTDPEIIRIVGWQHADIAYDRRMLLHYEPVIASFVGVSGRITGELAARLPARTPDIVHLPNAVPVGHAPPERLPARGRPLRLIYTGRLEQDQKRVTSLISLSDELSRRGVQHTLTLVGDGPAAAEVRALGADPEHTDRVRLPGALAPRALRDALREADCFVLPSRYEGLSVAMLEAMAEGCVPIVTATASGASEAIVDGLHGFLVDVADDAAGSLVAAAMADGVQRFLGSDTRAISVEAWRRVRDMFSLERYAPLAAQIIDRAATSAARTWPADRPCAFTTGPSTASGAGTVPADANQRLRSLLESLESRKIILHGGGRHTIDLASTLAASKAEIIAIADDDPARWGGTLLGWPVVSAADAARLDATDVIISSWLHADEIYSRRDVYERHAMTVHHLYRAREQTAALPYTSKECTNSPSTRSSPRPTPSSSPVSASPSTGTTGV